MSQPNNPPPAPLQEFAPAPAALAAAETLMLEHLAQQRTARSPYSLYTKRLDNGLPLGVIVFHGCTMAEGFLVAAETLIAAGLAECADCERRRQEAAA